MLTSMTDNPSAANGVMPRSRGICSTLARDGRTQQAARRSAGALDARAVAELREAGEHVSPLDAKWTASSLRAPLRRRGAFRRPVVGSSARASGLVRAVPRILGAGLGRLDGTCVRSSPDLSSQRELMDTNAERQILERWARRESNQAHTLCTAQYGRRVLSFLTKKLNDGADAEDAYADYNLARRHGLLRPWPGGPGTEADLAGLVRQIAGDVQGPANAPRPVLTRVLPGVGGAAAPGRLEGDADAASAAARSTSSASSPSATRGCATRCPRPRRADRRGRAAGTSFEHAPGAASGPGGGAAGTSSDASPLHRGAVDRYSPAKSATDGQRSYS